MSERLDRIGELLAKAAYLHLKKEKETQKAKEEKGGFNSRPDVLNSMVVGKNK